MKKLILGVVVFLVSLFVALIFLLPYKNIYNNAIDRYIKKMHLQASYEIKDASAFSIKIDKVSIKSGGYLFLFDAIKVRMFPFHYLFGGDLIRGQFVSLNNKYALIAIRKNNGLWHINVKVPASVIKNSVKGLRLPVIKNDTLVAITIKSQNNQLIIKNISIRGQINIDAQGYIKNRYLRLNGKIKLGNLRQNFNLNQML